MPTSATRGTSTQLLRLATAGCVDDGKSTLLGRHLPATRITERGATRADDRFSEAAMEDRKREGYF